MVLQCDGESDKVYSEARLEVAGYVHVMNGKGFLFSVFNSYNHNKLKLTYCVYARVLTVFSTISL